MNRMWNKNTRVMLIIVGGLGAQYKLDPWLILLKVNQKRSNIHTPYSRWIHRGSANILRKVLSI